MRDFSLFLSSLPSTPGIYKMRDEQEHIIYIGKAKNLKKRVSSYFQKTHLDLKTQSLVKHIADVEVILTNTETEALLLESTLIKQHQPRYNIIFKDDKSYPFVSLSIEADFPRLSGVRSRGVRSEQYFGPYPSMQSVKQTIQLLQKVFQLRTCEESDFKNRSRPCLLYQIKRCSGPCVGLISKEAYQDKVRHARFFLQGRDEAIFSDLAQKMEAASSALDFEAAGLFRDQIKMLRDLQEDQVVDHSSAHNIEVIALVHEGLQFCILVLSIRRGQVLGSREYFVEGQEWDDEATILGAFIEHLERRRLVLEEGVREWVVSHAMAQSTEEALLPLVYPQRGIKKKWLSLALLNAREALWRHLLQKGRFTQAFSALAQLLSLPLTIHRIECFDISHTQGEETVASCVVFHEKGGDRSAYRRFNIKGVQKGDDYAAIRQVLFRRFERLQAENESYPELVLIDGGKGQLKQGLEVLHTLGICGVQLVAISKGPERKPGDEEIWLPGEPISLKFDQNSPAFLLLQHIRDEAHRFAITGHRQKRDKKRSESYLERLPHIGPKRRQALLQYFGGWQEIVRARVEDLAKVPGLSHRLAQDLYAILHEANADSESKKA